MRLALWSFADPVDSPWTIRGMKIRSKASSYDAADAGEIGGASGSERTDSCGGPGGWPGLGGETLEKWKFILGFGERRRDCWTTSDAGDKQMLQCGRVALACIHTAWKSDRRCDPASQGQEQAVSVHSTIFRSMFRLPLTRWRHCFGLRKGQRSITTCFCGFQKTRIPTDEVYWRPMLATPTMGDIRWALMYWDSTEDGPW